jgi:hypothetical protein
MANFKVPAPARTGFSLAVWLATGTNLVEAVRTTSGLHVSDSVILNSFSPVSAAATTAASKSDASPD